jgi:hypothetical protein
LLENPRLNSQSDRRASHFGRAADPVDPSEYRGGRGEYQPDPAVHRQSARSAKSRRKIAEVATQIGSVAPDIAAIGSDVDSIRADVRALSVPVDRGHY